jgi:hypothetical protein
MYAGNSFSRRRSEGWVERRRYFRKLLAKIRPEADAKSKEKSAGSSSENLTARSRSQLRGAERGAGLLQMPLVGRFLSEGLPTVPSSL